MTKLPKSYKLPILLSLIIIIGFLAVSMISFFVSRESLRREIVQNELPLTSDNIYSEIQRDLLRPIFISSLMATDTFLRDWIIKGEPGTEQIVRYLQSIKEKYTTFTSFLVSDKSSTYYYADGILKTVSPKEPRDSWYYRVKSMPEEYEINVDFDMANRDAMTIFINYRVFDFQNTYIGATGVGLTVDAVTNLIAEYQKKYNRKIWFFDESGKVRLAGTEFDSSITTIDQLPQGKKLRALMNRGREGSFNYRTSEGTVHGNIRYVKEFHWYLVVEQSESEKVQTILSTLLINLLICFVITVICIVLVKITMKRYETRISELHDMVPICSHCHQIRDDNGYWNRVEEFITKETNASLSHSICPDCLEKYYPEYSE